MSRFLSVEMAARKAERHRDPEGLLWPDESNTDPFGGLPDDLPPAHSRFPIEPSSGYGDLSFVPPVGQNALTEDRDSPMTSEEMSAWRLAMRRALGNLVAVQINERHRG